MKTFEGCLGEHELLNGRKQRETLPVKIAMALIQYPIKLINQDMSQKGRYYRDINPQVLEAKYSTPFRIQKLYWVLIVLGNQKLIVFEP